jgi:hypothetical protein
MREAPLIAVFAGLLAINSGQITAFAGDLSTNRTEQNTATKRRVVSSTETMVENLRLAKRPLWRQLLLRVLHTCVANC